MNIIATFTDRRLAQRERRRFIEAQRIVDRVYEATYGERVEPGPELVYEIVTDGGEFLLVYTDPSVEE